MSKSWPTVRLGEVITLAQRAEVPMPGTTYRQIGVKLWGEGAYEREAMDGSQTKYAQLFRAETGDIIVNKIWARNGSVAVVPESLAGCFGSGEFPMFAPKLDRLESRWIHWITKTRGFWEQCDKKSRGTSGKNRIKPEQFLSVGIPLPPLAEQQQVVARIEALATQIHEARALRHQATEEAEALPLAELSAIFKREATQRGTVRLENLITEAGYGSSEKCDAERVAGATPVLRIPNVASERINLVDLKYTRLNQRDSERLLLSEGDVLVVRTNGSLELVGRSAVVPKLDESFAFASYMIRLRFDRKRIASDYAQRMMQHLRVAGVLVDFARTTAGQYNVSLGRLRAAEIPVPPLAEQRQIVAELDALQTEVDALKRLQTETTAELDALLPAILDKAFKGEL
jgi:type I restriction enzyme S subunit